MVNISSLKKNIFRGEILNTGKKTIKKTAKKAPKKTAKKKIVAKEKKGDSFECHVCGYRLVVDDVCGCMDEHVFVCCNKVMKKKKGRKTK